MEDITDDAGDAEAYRLEQARELLRSAGFVPVDPDDPDSPWEMPKETEDRPAAIEEE